MANVAGLKNKPVGQIELSPHAVDILVDNYRDTIRQATTHPSCVQIAWHLTNCAASAHPQRGEKVRLCCNLAPLAKFATSTDRKRPYLTHPGHLDSGRCYFSQRPLQGRWRKPPALFFWAQ